MSDVQELKSYLVSLGFAPNMVQYAKFEQTLKGAATLVRTNTASMATDLLKWQAGIVGMFTAVGVAVIGVAEKVSMADQEYRLFGQRMFMSTNQAKSLKIALDALGQPLEAIAFDPELHSRFNQLQKDQKTMQGGLGGDFETSMRQIRDIRFEFSRFEVELEYFAMGAVKEIFKALGFGSGEFAQQLHGINDYIIEHLPQWERTFATYVVPVLKESWIISKGVLEVLKEVGVVFTNLVGLLSGDSSIEGATFSFERLGHAILIVAGALKNIVSAFADTEISLLHVISALAQLLSGNAKGAGEEMRNLGRFLMSPGTAEGYDANGYAPGGSKTQPGGATADMRGLAASVGNQLGVPGSIIYSQWAHETGGFTNRGATQLNNFAGLKDKNGAYRSFNSPSEFANYYSSYIQRRYPGAIGSQDIDSYASALKKGGYMEDSLSNYESGMRSRIGGYSQGGSSSVTIEAIHILQPGASAEEIANTVAKRVKDAQDKRTTQNLTELKTVFG